MGIRTNLLDTEFVLKLKELSTQKGGRTVGQRETHEQNPWRRIQNQSVSSFIVVMSMALGRVSKGCVREHT